MERKRSKRKKRLPKINKTRTDLECLFIFQIIWSLQGLQNKRLNVARGIASYLHKADWQWEATLRILDSTRSVNGSKIFLFTYLIQCTEATTRTQMSWLCTCFTMSMTLTGFSQKNAESRRVQYPKGCFSLSISCLV